MTQIFQAGMAECHVTKSPNVVMALGLGSCVGVVVYDPRKRIGGMLHVMLPSSDMARSKDNPAKFADTGIIMLLEDILKMGGDKRNLVTKIAGGSQMFSFSNKGKTSSLNIGARNILAVKKKLEEVGLKLANEDTGGNTGRTMMLDLANSRVTVKKVGKEEVEI